MRFASHIYKSNLNGLFIDYTERKLSEGSALINEYTEQMILMIHFLKYQSKLAQRRTQCMDCFSLILALIWNLIELKKANIFKWQTSGLESIKFYKTNGEYFFFD